MLNRLFNKLLDAIADRVANEISINAAKYVTIHKNTKLLIAVSDENLFERLRNLLSKSDVPKNSIIMLHVGKHEHIHIIDLTT